MVASHADLLLANLVDLDDAFLDDEDEERRVTLRVDNVTTKDFTFLEVVAVLRHDITSASLEEVLLEESESSVHLAHLPYA